MLRRCVWSCVMMGAVLLSGCGYTTGSLLPSNYRTIAVEPFKNQVSYLNENVRGLYIPLLENKAHDAILTRFQFDGHLKPGHADRADLVLEGNLTGFDREELRLSDDLDVTEYRVRVTVSLKLFDKITGEVAWEEPSFSGEATYHLTGPLAKSEDAALQEALTDLARRVVERTLENW
jgi:hypothetical protein